ncbi:SDR family NAD(P)-dependent oxidoreductase [Rhodococcus sp. PD04]|uniref:SDR family NAD(P)-dependent oxidoreductase n=1 Tax=Rhodococcus sp. PD04 TaxID=3109594 RepID=UPI002DDC721E|nr:SDR family NAD(P)-dependent oxidoreductase [Rhodococcus sp. PD04]WSE25061.1 SDR family NAD(P)-dependent oxidoreductase [Rhodococcus sp. PD04]
MTVSPVEKSFDVGTDACFDTEVLLTSCRRREYRMQVKGHVALVTAAGGHTGSVIARVLAEGGASVALQVRRSNPSITRLVSELETLTEVHVIEGTIDNREGAADVVRRATKELGPVEILVNNAGGMRTGAFASLQREDLEFTLDANLRTAWWCAQAVVPSMMEQGFGRIVNVTSIGATGSAQNANYAVSKAATDGLTRTLALELGRHKITVNSVVPGLIANEKLNALEPTTLSRLVSPSPMGRAVESIDVANAVRFLASEEARFITGQLLHVSAGIYRTVAGMDTSGV